jgi:hypothetical protein
LREIDSPSFFVYNDEREIYSMDKDKLKLIVRNLELLVDSLKAEIYSDVSAYSYPEPKVRKRPVLDYDEIFEDSDLNEDFQ